MEKSESICRHVDDVRELENVPEPKEARNWKIYLYCIGVCFGGLALGMAFSLFIPD
jgi:hypothetical protein